MGAKQCETVSKGINKALVGQKRTAESKPQWSPMNVTVIINELDEVRLNAEEESKFRSIRASLLYIAVRTRPNLHMAASWLGSSFRDSRRAHMKAAKGYLRFLTGRRTMH